MGLFGLFNKKHKQTASDTAKSLRIQQAEKDRKANKELSMLQKADEAYKANQDLEKVIEVYQSVLVDCSWNTYNYQKKLASYYVKAGQYDKAWGMLSQALHDAVKRGHGQACTGQIRMEQFKVLKAEKKFRQALEFLSRAYVVNNAQYRTWNRDAFISHAKTCAKALGLSETQLDELANLVGRAIRNGDTSETSIRQEVSTYLKTIS